ncbi:hypothetical protein BJP36_41970 [Moorena producens JHB]|uniref:Uncharacterized protein n=1 Tax=Moorena producens (strain JHB) TaxID=1454205 RepID=A0A9Q9UVK7_MOOP1|nr:hypothetical protein [Moorena producens]WAN68928.1 hypothetical protein BJP36_41970 [Moorena producens JHB]
MTNSIGERISYKTIKYYEFYLFPITDYRLPITDYRFPTLKGKF